MPYFLWLKEDDFMQNLKLLDYTKKRLDDMYLVMYAIKNNVNMKKADIIDNIDIYTIVGINKRGIRQLVGIYQDRPLKQQILARYF